MKKNIKQHIYAHKFFSEAQTSHVILVFTSDWLNDVIITLWDFGWHDCWQWLRENQSLRFCCASSSFLFFSRLTLSESLLFFTGEQSWYFSLHEAFLCTWTIFFFYLSILTSLVLFFYFLRFEFSQCDIWYMRFSLDYEQKVRRVEMFIPNVRYPTISSLFYYSVLNSFVTQRKVQFAGIKQAKRIPWVD